MSWGRLCDCPRRDHAPSSVVDEPGACGKYAEDQERGGLCRECVSWDHKWTSRKVVDEQ